MAIPKEILEVKRPKNTRVKKNGNHYDVIKRTCVYKDGRRIPKELGKIGEIIDGKYIEKDNKNESLSFSNVDIKEYGRTGLCHMLGNEIFNSLRNSFSEQDAEQIYVMALLRSAYPHITDRDMKYRYDTSYISNIFPNIHLSENFICNFLELLGRNYNRLHDFMQDRLDNRDKDCITIVDGMLKDTTGKESSFVQWSRKSRTKGSKEISILYAFDANKGEPICHKVYPGNMLDMSSFNDFIDKFKLKDCTIMGDKGFLSNDNINDLKKNNSVHFLLPLKRSDKKIDNLNLLNFQGTFLDEDDVIEYSKTKKDDLFYYCFRNSTDASNERKGYLLKVQKEANYDNSNFEKKSDKFGVICFESDQDVNPKEVYSMYDKRWNIETFFGFYKNIVGLNNVRVDGDLSIIGTEFINMISTIISLKLKKKFIEKGLDKKYSFSQIMNYLDQLKKFKDSSKSWKDTTTLKYISELKETLEL